MPRVLAFLPALLLVALLGAGCTRSPSEQAALELAARAAGGGLDTYGLDYRTEIEGGYVWRVAPRPLGSKGDLPHPTHLGVVACIEGDTATEAVRFSFLHWEPSRCEGGHAKLRRVQVTPAQDAKRLDTSIAPPRGDEDDPELHRLAG
jgi:hypothetical protein